MKLSGTNLAAPVARAPRRRRQWLRLLLGFVMSVGFVVFLAWPSLLLLFKQYFTPAGSLMPTLQVGDIVIASLLAYGLSRHSHAGLGQLFPERLWAARPRRGDVAIVKLPRDGQTDYVKRVIGLPGERIQMREGRLYIDDTLVARDPAPPATVADRNGDPKQVPTYVETLPGGVRHAIIEIDGDRGALDNTQVFEVPPDHYFLMGDNRDNSTDSRLPASSGLGFVPFDNFVARALMITWSASPIAGKAPRTQSEGAAPTEVNWDRVFTWIR